MLTEREQDKSHSPWKLIVLLFIFFLLVALFLFLNSPYFFVEKVIVNGNKYVTVEEIYQIAAIPERSNIFRLDSDKLQKRLSNDLRLTDVEVKRNLPQTITITLKERQPLAYIPCNYGFVQVDRQGMVIAVFKNVKHKNLPLITGARLGNPYIGDLVEAEDIKPILLYLDSLDEATVNNLSEINIKTPKQLVAHTTDSIMIRLGDSQRLEEKAKLTRDILEEIRKKQIQVEYVDINYAVPFVKLRK